MSKNVIKPVEATNTLGLMRDVATLQERIDVTIADASSQDIRQAHEKIGSHLRGVMEELSFITKVLVYMEAHQSLAGRSS
jgi:hypothetical protein